ncbi:MAG TPA: hypothetical protein VFY23_06755 [Candidatus Limnocylindrales bacterium]|nr:hypothetical protein [Candidatus Limnocylindrales bacterium]
MGEQAIETGEPVPTPAREASWARFDSWARMLLLLLALLAVAVTVIFVANAGSLGVGWPLLAVILAGGGATAAAHWLGWHGLARGRPWGRHVAYWLLVLTVLTGVLGALVDLTMGKVTIPLGSIAAVLVLSAKPGPLSLLGPADRRVRSGVLALALAGWLVPSVATWAVTDEASPLTTSAEDVTLTIATTCTPADTVQPDRMEVTARWQWAHTDVTPLGDDVVTIRWSSPEDAVVVAEQPASEDGYARIREMDLDGGSDWTSQVAWDIDVPGAGQRDGSVSVVLEPVAEDPAARPADGQLFLQAEYARGDRWNAIVEDGCDW